MQNFFFIRYENRYLRIRISDILYLEARKNYVCIATEQKNYVVYVQLKQMERMLDVSQFCRVHRSFIVSLNHVDSFDNDSIYIRDAIVPIGKFYRDQLKERVAILVSDYCQDKGILSEVKIVMETADHQN